jgi:galactokinase
VIALVPADRADAVGAEVRRIVSEAGFAPPAITRTRAAAGAGIA